MKYAPRSKFDDIQFTDWRESAKGNYWRKCKGKMLVVGGSIHKGYWVRVGNNFLSIWQDTLQDAKDIAEYEAE
jgi:menaquinone-dependent protoporphyrinogen IX oxidase